MRLRYESRRFFAALFATFLPCGLLTAAIYIVYYICYARGLTTPVSYWFASVPDAWKAFLSILSPLDMNDPLAFFARAFMPVYLIESVCVAVTAGRGLTSDEGGMGELVYALPNSRTAVFFTRFPGGLFYVLLLNILLYGVSVAGYCVFCYPTATYLITYGVIFFRIALVQCVVYAIGTLYSACARGPGVSALWAALTVVFTWLLGILPSLIPMAGFLWFAALPFYAMPEYAFRLGPYFSLLQILVLGGVFILCTLAAFLSYRRREFFSERG
ncbi:MAG: hypothetical protein VB111_02500 [Clostridiaceae bacterium]|nr:hypothetical protein [Clostridiaceae bacterium]